MLPSLEIEITANASKADAVFDKTSKKIKQFGTNAVAAGKRGVASFSAGIEKMGKAAGGSLMQLRMLPQQFGQIAQQAAATGNILQAVAIQAIDIGAAFGVAGLAIGALATVAIPALGAAFGSTSEDASELEEAIKAVEDRAVSAADRLAMLNMGIGSTEELKLQQRINELVQIRSDHLRAEREAANRAQANSSARLAIAAHEEIQQLQAKLDRLRANEAQLAREEATIRRISTAYQQLGRSRVESDRQIVRAASEAYGLYADTRIEANKLASEIGHAAANALALAGVDITGPISAANKEAAALAGNLGIALNEAISLLNLQGSKVYGGRGGDPRQFMNQLGTAFTPSAATGGGGAANPLIGDLDAVREALATESELLQQTYQSQLETLQEALSQRLITQEEFQEQSLRSKQQYEEAMAEIERTRQNATLDGFAGMFGDLSSLMMTENKKLFNIGKAAAIAEATVNGYKAAVSAWEKGMSIGGPPVAAAFTAASLAKTGALISGIASQSIGGGSGASAGAVGGGGAPAVPEGPLNVRLSGLSADEMISGANLESLFDRLQDEAGDRGIRVAFA